MLQVYDIANDMVELYDRHRSPISMQDADELLARVRPAAAQAGDVAPA